jgi:hypothetical protein
MKDLDDQIELVKELIAKRQEIEEALAALFSGSAPLGKRRAQKCSTCGEEGHTARTCPTKGNAIDPELRKEPTFEM